MPFSVLMAVYHKEIPNRLEECLKSLEVQTLKPSEVILVEDGMVSSSLHAVIDEFRASLNIISIKLLENAGLATALNEGLKHCSFELVARMDTDDISVPDRFEKQYLFMLSNPDVSVCSGLIEEWSQDFSYKISERSLPLAHEQILKLAKYRSPVSHPAVMYRKSAVLAVGGYPIIYPEDYPLWGIMLAKGYVFANIPDLLVKMRIGDAITDRRGLHILRGEIKVYKYLLDVGFINTFEYILNCFLRSFVRLSPRYFKVVFYKYFR